MPPTLADHARKLNLRVSRPRRDPAPPFLLLLTDPRLADPVAAAARLPRGAGIVLRHYDDPNREALGRALARAARRRGLVLLVAGDAALAARLGADGLHLPEGLARHGLLAPLLRLRRGRGLLLTVAAHNRAALVRAARLGADATLLSPVFPTASHPGARSLGAVRFAALARAATLPAIALGGIDPGTARRLNGTGAAGIAAVSALG